MRDLVAGIIAVGLIVLALSLATTLTVFRRRRVRAREAEGARGRGVIAEIPVTEELTLFTEDADAFYYGDQRVAKDTIVAVRVLINGSPIAAILSRRHGTEQDRQATSFEDRPEGIARDRWDVALETTNGMVLVECGAIRERVSQELARTIFDAVKRDVEDRNARSSG
jgi:hypothetical protein